MPCADEIRWDGIRWDGMRRLCSVLRSGKWTLYDGGMRRYADARRRYADETYASFFLSTSLAGSNIASCFASDSLASSGLPIYEEGRNPLRLGAAPSHRGSCATSSAATSHDAQSSAVQSSIATTVECWATRVPWMRKRLSTIPHHSPEALASWSPDASTQAALP